MLPEWIKKLAGPAREMAEGFYRAVMAGGQEPDLAGQLAKVAFEAQFEEVSGQWQPRELVTGSAESAQDILFRAARQADDSGLLWEAVVIAPGISKSYPPFFWSEELLAESVDIFVGVDISAYELTADFFSHLPIPDMGMLEDVKRYLTAKKVGVIEKAWYETGVGIKAQIRFLAEQAWLPRTIQQGLDQGNAEVLGLSIDSRVKGFEVLVDDYKVLWVTKIVSASSVDVVTRPAAGGKFIRAVMGLNQHAEENAMKSKFLKMLQKTRPDLLAGKDVDKLGEEEVLVLAQQAMADAVAGGDGGKKKEETTRAAQDVGISAADVKKLLAAGIEQVEQRAACGQTLGDELTASKLPELTQARLRKQFGNTIFKADDLTAAIKFEKEYLSQMSAPGFENLGDQGRADVGLGSIDKIQIAVDRMFGLTKDDRAAMGEMTRLDGKPLFADMRAAQSADDDAVVASLSGIGEMYALLTGDSEVNGRFDRRNLLPDLRASQDITSATFGNLLGNTMGRRAVKVYRDVNFGEDLMISVRKPVKDFRTQEAINLGYFGDLADVDPETGDYQEIGAPTDEESTYKVGQKGNILTITRAMILNDDVTVVQRLIKRLMRAAARTHGKYVWNFFMANTNCSDGTAWFTAGHGNLVTTALSFASAFAMYQALAGMTEKDSGEPIAMLDDETVKPVLIYPTGLMAAGESIVNDEHYFTGNDLTTKTRNPLFGKIDGRKISLLTDANDWGMLLPPDAADMVEMGYLNGRQDPELFLADGPQAEAVFLSDKIRYKIRHEYAGTVVDYVTGGKSQVI
ncbi:MAG: hypothetical protein ABFS18_02135 [Thermodesulfobacteriota bacterium]